MRCVIPRRKIKTRKRGNRQPAKQVDQLTASQQKAANPNLQLTDSDFRITEYSDTLVARIIERIEVISAVRIKIEFIGGYTVTVPLQS